MTLASQSSCLVFRCFCVCMCVNRETDQEETRGVDSTAVDGAFVCLHMFSSACSGGV
ncbi:hypothetical protein LZ30DRAFT_727856 [Colletotrichum cereale]|nr:hypothetical protein LZ30DRAFT_727856 [Colletotrichum cereale]